MATAPPFARMFTAAFRLIVIVFGPASPIRERTPMPGEKVPVWP
jgi:hypothetical protein